MPPRQRLLSPSSVADSALVTVNIGFSKHGSFHEKSTDALSDGRHQGVFPTSESIFGGHPPRHSKRKLISYRAQVLPERDLMFKDNPMEDYYIEDEEDEDEVGRSNLAELFNVLCACSVSSRRVTRAKKKKNCVKARRQIVYPIAKYAGNLDDAKLLYQRRKSLASACLFRPIA